MASLLVERRGRRRLEAHDAPGMPHRQAEPDDGAVAPATIAAYGTLRWSISPITSEAIRV